MTHFSTAPPVFAVAFGLVLAGSVFAQEPPQRTQAADRSVESMCEYTGPATVSKERIMAQMRTAVGQPYSDAVVEAGHS